MGNLSQGGPYMGIKVRLLAVFLPLTLIGTISNVYAASITIDFGGECQALNGAGPVLKITNGSPFPCGDYTIEKRPNASDEARVDTGNDGSNDRLMFLDAKITKKV